MPTIPLGIGDWESPSEDISRIRLRNMYLIDNPHSPDGVSRVSRPTLTDYITIGDGPIFGMFRQDAVFGGDWFVVSGEELYRYDETAETAELIDTIPGTGYCQFAGIADRLIVVRDGTAYSYDGEEVTIVIMPDDVPPYEELAAPVQSVATINSYFILSVLGTQRYYWIAPGETDPDPLSFNSAERVPDAIESVNVLMDEIWFIGTSGPEVHQPVNDPDLPFQRLPGRVYSDGCASRDTVVQAVSNDLPCLVWVTDTRSVVMAQGNVRKISSESVEEQLKTATNLRAYSFRHTRHDFYILTCDEFTLAYDLSRDSWSRWDTYLLNNWRAHLGLMSGPRVYAGDYQEGKIWRLEAGQSDYGQPIVREVSGLVLNQGKPIKCSSITVRVNAGWSPSYGFTPTLELRWSDDQGFTWSDYTSISMGDRGEYNTDTIFRSLGLITRPGRNFEFRFSQPARFRLDYAVLNEV